MALHGHLKGEPLPFISKMPDKQILTDIEKDMAAGKAVSFTPMFESLIQDHDLISDTEIPVEKINGPVLLISGQGDQLWPSTKLSEIAVQRLDSKSFKHEVIHLSYPNAGHLIGRPYRPTTVSKGVHPVNGILLKLGGTPAGNAHACEDSWQHFLSFLEDSFSL